MPEQGGGGVRPEQPSPAAVMIERLGRWQHFGAVWRVLERSRGTVTIALCRCDDGEEVDRLRSGDPELLSWLGDRTSSEG